MNPSLLLLTALLATTAESFVNPTTSIGAKSTTSLEYNGLAHSTVWTTTMLLSDNNDMMLPAGTGGAALVNTVTSVLTGVVGIAFFLVGLTYLMAAVIIPQAAKQLEQQTKELDPELWAKYQSQLEPGQTIDQRPDLMQELGEKMQKLMEAKFKEEQQQQSIAPTEGNEKVRPQALDAEIMSKDATKIVNTDDQWTE